MAQFDRSKIEMFLGVIRKYMQVRGSLSQKDLATSTGVGVSTMSRFLTQKTTELNAQMIAKIVAKLKIPLHEMIDFVDESYADYFIRLVKFYKSEEEGGAPPGTMRPPSDDQAVDDEVVVNALGVGSADRATTARIKIGGRKNSISFESDHEAAHSKSSIREKMEQLTARQKGFLNEFLNLDADGRDLVVDIGKNIIAYLRQKGLDF